MRGDSRAIGARPMAAAPGRRWPAWINRMKRSERMSLQEQLEVMERLSHEERRARRTGEFTPEIGRQRRWF